MRVRLLGGQHPDPVSLPVLTSLKPITEREVWMENPDIVSVELILAVEAISIYLDELVSL